MANQRLLALREHRDTVFKRLEDAEFDAYMKPDCIMARCEVLRLKQLYENIREEIAQVLH